MSDENETLVWDIATCTYSEYVGGFLGVQIDGLGTGATAPTFQAHYPYGFFARPRDPDPGADGTPGIGCNALYGWEGERGHVFPLGDPRLDGLVPESPKGSAGLVVLRDDGEYSAIRLGGDDGAFVVIVHDSVKGDSSLRLDRTNGLTIHTPWFDIKGGPQGFHIVTTAGSRLDLGSIGGLPAPFSAVSSTAKLTGGVVSVQGSIVKLGTGGGIENEVATTALTVVATALATAMGALQAAIVELSTTPAAIGKPALSPATAAPLEAAATALATAATTLAPLAIAIGKVV